MTGLTGLDGCQYRYGFASGNVYRFKEYSELEVRDLQSGCWKPSESRSLLTNFIFGKGVLPGGSEEADKIFKTLQASLKKTS